MNDSSSMTRRSALATLGASLALAPFLSAADKNKSKTKKDPNDDTATKQVKGKYHGFGAAATGGEGYPTVEVNDLDSLAKALKKGNCTIVLKAKVIEIPKSIIISANNITIDGQGNTLRGDKIGRSAQMLKFKGGSNYIVKNVHLRNGGDNIEFYSARDIVIDHVSSTGAGDDGISLCRGTQNATVTHCFLAGNTRGIFCKYSDSKKNNTKNLTIDHTIIMKLYMRAPLVDKVEMFDFRNNFVEEWVMLATRLSGDTLSGNVMGNIYNIPKDSRCKGNAHHAIVYHKPISKLHIKDNDFRNCSAQFDGNTDAPLAAPAIVPAYSTDFAKLEKYLFSETEGAGCMPRDIIDKAYIKARVFHADHDNAFRIPPTGQPLPEKESDIDLKQSLKKDKKKPEKKPEQKPTPDPDK